MSQPMVSIIIPTRNEERDIEECLRSIREQSYKNKEVIVVDGDSTDKTREIAKKFKAIILEETPRKGPANARNIGVKMARGDIVFWIDADCILEKNSISVGVKYLLKEGLDGIAPLTVIYPTKKIIPNIYYAERLSSKMDVGPNFLKRDVFLKFRFNPSLGVGEDYELSQRIRKGKVSYKLVRECITYHKEPDFKKLVSESRWWGRTYLSLLKNGGIKPLFSLLWIFFISTILPLAVLSFFFPKLWIFSYFLIAIYSIYSLFKIFRSVLNGAKVKYAVFIPFFKILRYSLIFMGIIEGLLKKSNIKGK